MPRKHLLAQDYSLKAVEASLILVITMSRLLSMKKHKGYSPVCCFNICHKKREVLKNSNSGIFTSPKHKSYIDLLKLKMDRKKGTNIIYAL